MNELTKRIVTETAKAHPSEARRDGYDFTNLVREAWWSYLMVEYGIEIQNRKMAALKRMCPAMFDEEGFIRDYEPWIYDWEVDISNRVVEVLHRKIDLDPELELNTDWGDLPTETASPQMRLF